MDCDSIKHLLDAFADGELQLPQQQIVEEHLKQCPSCQKELSAIHRTIRLLSEFREVDEPTDFVQQVRQRIEMRRGRHILERLLPRPALAGVLVGAACLVLAGFGVWLAFKHFFPAERSEEHRAEGQPAPIRIARVPAEKRAFDLGKAGEAASDDFEAGEKAASPEKAMAKAKSYGLGQTGVERMRETVEGVPAEPGAVAAEKFSPIETDGEGKLAGLDKAELAFARHLAARPAIPPSRGPQGQEATRKDESAPAKGAAVGLATGRIAPAVSAPAQVAHEKESSEKLGTPSVTSTDATGRMAGTQADRDTVRGGSAASDEKKERKEPIPPPAAKDDALVNIVDTHGRKKVEWEEAREQQAAEAIVLSAAKPAAKEEEVHDLAETGLVRLKSAGLNGTVAGQGLTALPQIQIQESGKPAEGYWFFTVGGNLAAYEIGRGAVPELILYVTARQKALAEIKSIVAELGGTTADVPQEARQPEQTPAPEQGLRLVVRIRADAYPTLREKLLARRVALAMWGRAQEQPQAPKAEETVPQKDGIVTLLIRLLDIAPQEKASEPPAK